MPEEVRELRSQPPQAAAPAAQPLGESELRARNLLDFAWSVIANAHRPDWAGADPEWRGAAERWRDSYHDFLARTRIR